MTAFVLILIILLSAKYVTSFMISGSPLSARQVKKRHENAVERVRRGIDASSSGYRVFI